MRRTAVAATVVGCAALAVPAATAKTTKDFNFKSHGTAVGSGAVLGTGAPTTYEDFPVTIKPDERDGAMSVGIRWQNPADDWDLYVYQKIGGTLEQVGSSAGGPPDTTEDTTVQSQGVPLPRGNYVIRVQNYAATSPNFSGTVKFSPFIPLNKLPTARLKAPRRAVAGRKVTLDARRSRDPDGKITSYAFDLDGNGTMETKAGKHGRIRRRFKHGRRHVTVRVTDNKGARAYATRTIRVYRRK